MTAAFGLPLMRDSDFQAAWYFSMVIFAAICLTAWGTWLVARHVREIWVRGEQTMALVVGVATAVSVLLVAAILVTVIVAMLPAATGGGAG